MDQGWIKVHRKMKDHEIWQNPNYFCVWMYILLHVNHAEKRMLWNGKKVLIPRGGGILSQVKIAKHFGMGRATVRRAFDYLQSEQMADIKTTNKFSYVQVKNYEKYQVMGIKRASSGHQADTNKNEKNEKKQTRGKIEKNTTIKTEDFVKEYHQRKKDGWRCQYGDDLVCIRGEDQIRLKLNGRDGDEAFVDFNDSLLKLNWIKKL